MTTPKILIADDDERILTLLQQAFKDQEWEIFLAQDGDEALEALVENEPDVALLDLRMPNADGISILGDMRRRGIDTDVLILTGYGTVDSAVEAMKQGAKDFLAKPFHIKQVVEKIKGLLKSRYGVSESLIEQMDHYLKDRSEESGFRLSDLCDRFKISERYASKLFREKLGTSFRRRLADCRLEKAKHLLEQTNLQMFRIAEMCGFSSYRQMTTTFTRLEGVTPTEYRRNH